MDWLRTQLEETNRYYERLGVQQAEELDAKRRRERARNAKLSEEELADRKARHLARNKESRRRLAVSKSYFDAL